MDLIIFVCAKVLVSLFDVILLSIVSSVLL